MKIITIDNLRSMVARIGLETFLDLLIETLEEDLARWNEFSRTPRLVNQYPQGVIELMPWSDAHSYTFKYVNGHPGNAQAGKLSIIAIGLLADTDSGFPLLLSEMTLLTAFRTAATMAVGAKHLARPDSHKLTLIGTGAQAEFQTLAASRILPIEKVYFHDIDARAMEKFARHMQAYPFELIPCSRSEEAVTAADLLITATARRARVSVLSLHQVQSGTHIHAMGGDCAGKTELDPALLAKSKIVVEYMAQCRREGEIQNNAEAAVHAELWELVTGSKPGREDPDEITLLDAVGIALEDFSALRLVHRLSNEMHIGEEINLIPQPDDPKDLFGLL